MHELCRSIILLKYKWGEILRLDKYLKLSRLIKRRTVAQEMAEIGAVRVNKRQCKPAAEVREDDVVEIAYPRRILTVKVLTADETALKRNATAYTVIEEKEAAAGEKPW